MTTRTSKPPLTLRRLRGLLHCTTFALADLDARTRRGDALFGEDVKRAIVSADRWVRQMATWKARRATC